MYSICQLANIFYTFFALLSCLHNERDHITLLSLVMKSIIPENSPLKSYAEIVTPCAFKHIEQQSSVKYNPDSFSVIEDDDSKFSLSSSEGELTLSETYCQCRFWKSMNLPCKHILSVYNLKCTPPDSDLSTFQVFIN